MEANDAYQDGDPQVIDGQPVNENVGQDVGNSGTENPEETNWEESARYFQSEKDKLSAENDQLKKYAKVGKMLESRPDLVQNLMGQLQTGGGQPADPQRIQLSQDDFDPWEAFNDPKSKSYQYREQQMNTQIESRVNERMSGLTKQVGKAQLQNEVINSGLISREEAPAFMQFIAQHPSKHGLNNVVKMFRAVSAGDPALQAPNPLDQVRQNQQAPTPAGILGGEQPQRTSESDDMWASIVNAGSRNKVL